MEIKNAKKIKELCEEYEETENKLKLFLEILPEKCSYMNFIHKAEPDIRFSVSLLKVNRDTDLFKKIIESALAYYTIKLKEIKSIIEGL
jgi:hypothetical protein